MEQNKIIISSQEEFNKLPREFDVPTLVIVKDLKNKLHIEKTIKNAFIRINKSKGSVIINSKTPVCVNSDIDVTAYHFSKVIVVSANSVILRDHSVGIVYKSHTGIYANEHSTAYAFNSTYVRGWESSVIHLHNMCIGELRHKATCYAYDHTFVRVFSYMATIEQIRNYSVFQLINTSRVTINEMDSTVNYPSVINPGILNIKDELTKRYPHLCDKEGIYLYGAKEYLYFEKAKHKYRNSFIYHIDATIYPYAAIVTLYSDHYPVMFLCYVKFDDMLYFETNYIFHCKKAKIIKEIDLCDL